MKSMILFLIIFHFGNISFSQKNKNYFKINTGAELTSGLFAEGYKSGWGIYASHYYNIGKEGNFVISSGIAFWNESNGTSKAGMSLTRVGLRQFVYQGFYFQADAGIGLGLKNFSETTRFCFGGGAGYLFKNAKGNGVDISVRINRGFNRTWIGIGAGYQFRLGNRL